ncbi:unnamed protein product [Euphydryas editha]|uniref:Uncharacterized protein n=1 Tax=Euphydryas editha TaxID=104508 RepID=A0AAU9TU82_EUPED|nr:unnamed protein product [Euphydryas editha]
MYSGGGVVVQWYQQIAESLKSQSPVLTGHSGFSEYLHRFKCKKSPSCICDPGCSEFVLHVLLDYPAHDYKRQKLECQLDVILELDSLSELVYGNNKDLFLQFCIKVCKIVNNRNGI